MNKMYTLKASAIVLDRVTVKRFENDLNNDKMSLETD